MPTETVRIIKRKRITLPSGSTVDIPVITQITFLDHIDRGQETQYTVDNTSAGHRDTHIASIPGDGQATDETGTQDGLKVERVDLWRVLDHVERSQQTYIAPDSKTVAEPPTAPPFFTTHEKTHIVKYINTPDNGLYIKSELIDKFKFRDSVDRGQETEYTLINPPDNTNISGITIGSDNDGTTIAVDPSVDEITDAVNPVRTDPFQNIIDLRGGGPAHVKTWVIGFIDGAFLDLNGSAELRPLDGDTVIFFYSFIDNYGGAAQAVSGTISGMPSSQVVGLPLEYTGPVSQNLVGTTYTAVFQKVSNSSLKTITWDISGMIFTPSSPNPQFSPRYVRPHNPQPSTAGPRFNVILTGSAN